MLAFIYKSVRKDDTYLYLKQREGFDALPAPLRKQLGDLEFVFEVDLSSPRRLARADVVKVRASLLEAGYYLQLPPRHPDALDDRG
jgi:uncharacterized protein